MSVFEGLLLDPYPVDRFLAIRTDGISGSGTKEDPWNADTQAKFDSIMRQLSQGSGNFVVHLSPGIFYTRGFSDVESDSNRWEIRAGIKIAGSGMHVTTLKLITTSAIANNQYFAIGHRLIVSASANPATGCEVSDLTIDCGVASADVACGAIRLMGSEVRVKRVKAINWGNKIPTAQGKKGFVFQIVTANPETDTISKNCGFEDCIAVEPASLSPGYLNQTLIFHAGGKDYVAANEIEESGEGPFIRNCWVDCGSLGSGTDYFSKFVGLSMSNCVGGKVEGNQVHNTWTGGPFLKDWSARELFVLNNVYRNVVNGPCFEMGGLGFFISIPYLELNDGSTKLAKATTGNQQAHKLKKGDRVKISGASPSEYNGVFLVAETPFPYVFTYEMASRPATNAIGGISMWKVLGIEKINIEGNLVELAAFNSPLPTAIKADAIAEQAVGVDYVYGDLIISGNHVRILNGRYSEGFTGYAVDASGVRYLNVKNNVVSVDVLDSLRNQRCGNVCYYNNKRNKGSLIQGLQTIVPQFRYSELDEQADEAYILSFSRKK